MTYDKYPRCICPVCTDNIAFPRMLIYWRVRGGNLDYFLLTYQVYPKAYMVISIG